MRKLILHLGGGIDRADKCIQLANIHQDTMIFVSSETGDVLDYYTQRGIPESRVFLDDTAWDTVTNFTKTYRTIKKKFRPQVLYVVTHDFHMNRSMRIANAVYWMTGVKVIASPSGGPNPYGPEYNYTEPPRLIREDTIRAWIWRLTRILFYFESIRKARTGMGSPKQWNEIGL